MTDERRLIVSEFVTLDGVMEAPGHEEHPDGRNAWALRGTSEDQQRYKVDELIATGAILLGRVTYQIFAAFWPTAPASEFKDGMNAVPKHVVSRTLQEPTWSNTSIVRDVAREVPELKATPGGDILVHGSADLVDSLMRLRLVDELRIMVFPVVLGSGKRLFRDESDLSHLELVETRSFSSGVVLLTYRPALEAPWSEYEQEYAWTEEHVRSMQAAKDPDRVLASVLFTDIVDST
ncbi:MAG TPA: dihydrofolate reductase family protein, partial [Actinomycetota bacterium]|nr:dihydrofolate reductase family protein [Actinomycetota bacterium]